MSQLALLKNKYRSGLAESDLRRCLKADGYSVFSWQDGPGQYYSPHSHPHDEFIVVAVGSIKFMVGGEDYILEPGDMLVLPANTVHEAVNEGSTNVTFFVCSK